MCNIHWCVGYHSWKPRVLVLQLHLCILLDVFVGYSPHVMLLHCKDVHSLTLVPILSLLVALITQLQFCCSCPDVLVSALHLCRRGYGFESRLSVNLFSGFHWIATCVVQWSIMCSCLKIWGLGYSDIAIPRVPEGFFFTAFAIRKKKPSATLGNLAMETKKTVGLLATRLERRLTVIELFLPLIRTRNDCWSEELYQIEIGHQGEKLQSFQLLPEGVNFLAQHLPLQALCRCWNPTHQRFRCYSLSF